MFLDKLLPRVMPHGSLSSPEQLVRILGLGEGESLEQATSRVELSGQQL